MYILARATLTKTLMQAAPILLLCPFADCQFLIWLWGLHIPTYYRFKVPWLDSMWDAEKSKSVSSHPTWGKDSRKGQLWSSILGSSWLQTTLRRREDLRATCWSEREHQHELPGGFKLQSNLGSGCSLPSVTNKEVTLSRGLWICT